MLADALARRPDDPAAALRQFEAARKPRVRRISLEARRNLGIYGVGGLIVPFVGIKLIDMAVSGLGHA